MLCESCGATIPAGINVCLECGKKTDDEAIDPDRLMKSIARKHGRRVGAAAARAEMVDAGRNALATCCIAPFQLLAAGVVALVSLGWPFVTGLSFFSFACWLRVSARWLAWPSSYRFSGDREDTVWAAREQAYQDIALWLALLGIALIIVAALRWRGERSEA